MFSGLLFWLAVASSTAQGPDQPAATLSGEVKEVFARCGKAVVKIHGVDEHSEIVGTGFFIDPTGTICTSYSVGGEGENFTIEFNGKKFPAHQLLADVRSALAMLKADLTTPALPIGNSSQLEVATPVVAVGYPLDLPETPSFGMIAGFDRKYLGQYFPTVRLRVNTPVQRGEAGAPLLNLKGEVVGVLVSSLENGSSCYAVPIEVAEKIKSDFVRFGEVRHGFIGVNVAEAADAIEGSRAEMTDLLPDTPAAESGLKAGDILLQVGKKDVHQPEDVLDASFFITAGDNVPIVVMRDGKKMTFNIQADLHPAMSSTPRYPDGSKMPTAADLDRSAIPLSAPAPKR